MKEIKFRAKDLIDNEWLYGFPVFSDKDKEYCRFYVVQDEGYKPCLVRLDTVSQFTGLCNVVENEIYDGDIVKFDDKLFVVKRECDTLGGSWSNTAYILDEIGTSSGMAFEDTIDDYCNEICVEIVGNVYDNPELLKGDDEIDDIRAADVQPVKRWISVNDRLPDANYDCLVWYSCDTAFGKCKSWGIAHCSRCDWDTKHLDGDNIEVLYWMPLPEPPKDGE